VADSFLFWCLFGYLLLAGKGGAPPDVVTLIDADDYFRARHITASADRVEALARTEPADGPRAVAQLLAIRWLGDHRIEPARETLMRIVGGQLAQDKYGFARDYARHALARLDGQPLPQAPAAGKDLREALGWFPGDATAILALDLRTAWAEKPFTLQHMGVFPSGGRTEPPFVLGPALLLGPHKEEFYRWAERFGNVEIDRVVAATLPPARPDRPGRWVLRLTGRGNWQGLIDYLQQDEPFSSPARDRDANSPPVGCGDAAGTRFSLRRWERGPDGEPISVLRSAERGVTLAVVGDADVILADGGGDQAGDLEAVEQVLRARAGRPGGIARGPLTADLEQIPDDAAAFWVGQVPEDRRQALTEKDGWPAAPRRVVAFATADGGGETNLHFRLRMDTPEQARALADTIHGWRQGWMADVAKLRPDRSAEVVLRAVESVTAEAQGASVSGEAGAAGDFPEALGEVVEAEFALAVVGSLGQGLTTLIRTAYVVGAVVMVGVLLLGLALVLGAARRRASGR
jgi:hypothetical protein